jgi:hypothetical protein
MISGSEAFFGPPLRFLAQKLCRFCPPPFSSMEKGEVRPASDDQSDISPNLLYINK